MAPKRSLVWEHFEQTGTNYVMCKHCKKKFKFCNNTSNMRLHLKGKHIHAISTDSDIPEDSAMEERQTPRSEIHEVMTIDQTPSTSGNVSLPISELPAPSQKRPRQLKLFSKSNSLTEQNKKSIDYSLVKMIAQDLQPLSIVENKGFLEYSQKLQPLYNLPSRKVLTNNLIPNICKDISANIRSKINLVKSVGITTDIWSSDTNNSFLSCTCHYIYNDDLVNSVLDTVEIPGSHTGENIASALANIFSNWGISGKIIAIITDNGANIKNAVSKCLFKTHVPCVAHTLNLCVVDAISDNARFEEIVKTCKTIVTHFKSSNLSADKLRELQTQMRLPTLRVKQDVVTRWNSTLFMIERLLEIREPLSAAIAILPNAPRALDTSEWTVMMDCAQILQPIQAMTEEMSGEKYPTISMVIPLVRGVQFALNQIVPMTVEGTKLKEKLIAVVSKRFADWETNKIAAKATFLDPRFKKTAFGLDENADKAEDLVLKELENLLRAKVPDETNNLPVLPDDEIQQDNVPEQFQANNKSVARRQKLWELFDSKAETKKSSPSVIASAALMLKHYLDLPLLDRWKNPLPYCSTYKSTFEELYEMQKKYLSIPATSVPSERLFSKAGQIANDRRNRLSGKNLNNILFLNSNM